MANLLSTTLLGNNHITLGPNATWSSYLRVGGNGHSVSGNEYASVVTTNGNLHLDAGTSRAIYLNYYAGTSGVAFGNGSSGISAWMGADGDLWKGGGDNSGTQYVYNSGTWGISITGNANTATSAGSATSASTAGFSDEAKWISYPDGPRDLSDRSPSWNNRSVAWDFVGAGTANGSGNYGGVMTFVPWDGTSASTGDSSYQLAFANTTGVNASGQPKLSIRNGINSTWNAWYTLIHSGNIGSQSVSYANSAGSAGTAGSAGSVDGLTINNSGNVANPNTVTQNQIGYNDSIALFGQSDGGLHTSAYSSAWMHQIFGDFRSGQIAIRGKNSGTFGDWRIVVDDKNVGTYAVPYGNMTSSTGLNDNKLYLRTNGDNNHYIWNAADDWEEIVAFSGTGLRIASSTGVTLATFSTSGNSMNITGNATYSLNSTRLYASDGSYTYGGAAPYYMYMNYDGGSYWELKVSPATPGEVRVAYANSAGSVAWGNVSSKPSNIMFYEGFTLDANTMTTNSTGFTYSVNAPFTGPIVRFSTNGQYDLWLGGSYLGGGNSFFLRTRNGDNNTLNAWREIITSGNIGSQSVTSLNSSNFISQKGSNGSWNADFSATPAGTASYGGDLGANGVNGPGGSWWLQQNFRHTNGGSLWGAQVAWGWEDNANRLATRSISGGTFGAWVYYLNSSNFTTWAQEKENQRLSTTSSPTFVDIYANEWFRNNNVNEGLYNQATGTHFYSHSAQGWVVTGSGGTIELQFRSNHQSTLRGYVYADTSNQIGFLNNAGGWTLRTNSSSNVFVHGPELTINADGTSYSNIIMNDGDEGSRIIHCNSNRIGFLNQAGAWGSWCNDNGSWQNDTAVYSPVFYDSDDSTYYLDPNSQGLGLKIAGNLEVFARSAGWAEGIRVRVPSTSTWGGIRFTRDRGNYDGNWAIGYTGIDATDDLTFWGNLGGTESMKMRLDQSSNLISYGSMRAPIFYDSADTSYYLDPNADLSLKVYGEICNSNYQAGRLQPGALNIGRTDLNYAWEGGTWAEDVRVGILANCSETWEIAVHDSGDAVKSLIHFDGGSTITMGRDIGWSTCVVNSPSGYVSNGNPWSTANSAFFPNGITTAGGTNWIYGTTTFIGNAPGNGAGHDFSSSGHQYSTGSITTPLFLVNGHSDNTKGYRIHNTSGSSVSAMFTNSSNQLVIAAGAVDQINLNKKVYVNGVALGVNVAPSATAGRIDASNDIVAYSSSDERLKENITPIANALDKVKSLTGVEFDWKPEYKGAHGHEGHDTGIIAQQVLGVMPSAVRTNDTGYLAVRYEKLIGLLIEANKELAARVEELEKKIG